MIKCTYCGRFVKISDVKFEVIPDSYFTKEQILPYHSKCYNDIKVLELEIAEYLP